MTITDFLLARIAEDEARANAPRTFKPETPECEMRSETPDLVHVRVAGRWMPFDYGQFMEKYAIPAPDTRLLRECEAKRQIVAEHEMHTSMLPEDFCRTCGYTDGPCATKRALAAVYASHPDYQPEWAPEWASTL